MASNVAVLVGSLPLLALATPALGRHVLAHPGALWSALYLAVPCTLLGYAAWIWALKRLPAGEVAAFVFLNGDQTQQGLLQGFFSFHLAGNVPPCQRQLPSSITLSANGKDDHIVPALCGVLYK